MRSTAAPTGAMSPNSFTTGMKPEGSCGRRRPQPASCRWGANIENIPPHVATTATPAVFGRRTVSLLCDRICSLLRLGQSQTVHLVHRDRAGSTLGFARHHLRHRFVTAPCPRRPVLAESTRVLPAGRTSSSCGVRSSGVDNGFQFQHRCARDGSTPIVRCFIDFRAQRGKLLDSLLTE